MTLRALDDKTIHVVASSPNLLICLDYDGTLTPIVSRPFLARLHPRARIILKKLSKMPGVKIVIMSGRALGDLEKQVGLKGLGYVGNHGLERNLGGHPEIDSHAIQLRGFILKLTDALKRAMKNVPAVLIENKTYSATVHYRNLSPSAVAKARRIFRDVWSNFSAKIFFKIRPGKKVWEIRPRRGCSDKGRALQLILRSLTPAQRKGLTTVCVGDDKTDEDAFAVLRRSDVAIYVGESQRTMARCRLRETGAVLDLLEKIKSIRQKASRVQSGGKPLIKSTGRSKLGRKP